MTNKPAQTIAIALTPARPDRLTALPVKEILKSRLKDLELKNTDLQKALGYPRPNVIAMMKKGTMRLPANKAVIAAELLEVDPVFLLSKVIAESDADLWDVISLVMADRLITANEMAVLRLLRQLLNGHDVNLAESRVFQQAVESAIKTGGAGDGPSPSVNADSLI